MSLSVARAMCVKRRAIFDFGVAHGFSSLTSTDVIRYLERTSHQDVSGSTKAVGRLLSDFGKRWKTANRKKDRFLALNRAWLNGSLCLPRPTCRSPGGSRRRTPFSELSRNSKLRVTSELRRHSSRELVFAAASATYQEGRRSAGRLVEAVGSPVRGPPLAAALSSAEKSGPRPYTPEEALALLVDLGLSKSQYVSLQQQAKHRGADLYPTYDRVRQAKAASLPPLGSVVVAADSAAAELSLQTLLDHTAERLLQLPTVRRAVGAADLATGPAESPRLTLSIKWGMDGSTGHSQ